MLSLHPRYPVLKVPAPARLSAAVAQGLIMPEGRPPGDGNIGLHVSHTIGGREPLRSFPLIQVPPPSGTRPRLHLYMCYTTRRKADRARDARGGRIGSGPADQLGRDVGAHRPGRPGPRLEARLSPKGRLAHSRVTRPRAPVRLCQPSWPSQPGRPPRSPARSPAHAPPRHASCPISRAAQRSSA